MKFINLIRLKIHNHIYHLKFPSDFNGISLNKTLIFKHPVNHITQNRYIRKNIFHCPNNIHKRKTKPK